MLCTRINDRRVSRAVGGMFTVRVAGVSSSVICCSVDPKFRAVGGSLPIVCRIVEKKLQTHSQAPPCSRLS